MEGKDGRSRSTDESGSEKNPRDDAAEQKNLLEEEIKKIIDDLDIKFEDSPVEEDPGRPAAAGFSPSASIEMYPTDRPDRMETQQVKVESASTVSNAVTVVQQQRTPAKISATHLKSPRDTFHRTNKRLQSQGEFLQPYNRLTDSPRHHGVSIDSDRQYGVAEHGFYQPERDEITEPTTSETHLTSTEHTTTPYGHSTHHHARPSQYMPPLPEEHCGKYRDHRVTAMHHHQHRPYEMLPNNDFNAPWSHYRQPSADPSRHSCSVNYPPVDQRDHEYQSHFYQDVEPLPYPPETQEPHHMKENVNRYNNNHRTYSTVKEPERPGRQSITDFILTKSRSFFGRRDDSDSGEVIPQLYKACVKNGTSPPRFTFKAVTGIQPPVAPYPSYPAHPQHVPAYPHYDHPNGAQPRYEPVTANPCCCPPELPKTYKDCCGENCEIITMPAKSGIKTKAYYSDLGCGYISDATVPEKVDVYCFDQLNTGFFRTSDHPPPLFADIAVQRTEKYANVFWAEVYGVANVGTAFAISLILQTIKFILQGVIRPLMIGIVQLFSDYFIKPLLTLLYNGFTQPLSIFIYNVIASIRDILQPIAKGVGYFAEVVAVILRSIRLVEVKNVTNITPCSPPQSVKYTC
ncbi:hypothetical protein GE061_006323 [Apolygus lucorum]|uniref:Uncharacterized protein n=1 Tax=Apolygus lucorum TaxID=248454 RepID=A0A8S9WTL1_APOLU|nr:hypothetical protein GE061_006323 [Apolygus lucorum]